MKNKILLIDDDEDLLRAFQINLEIFGYKITTAHNKNEALLRLKETKPDLIVLDIVMDTNLEGFDLLYKLKESKDYVDLPILVLTGITDKLGVNFFSGDLGKLPPNVKIQEKPVPPIFLVELIENMLIG